MDDLTFAPDRSNTLSREAAIERIANFAQDFGEAHLTLAYHAAFPLVLTPDLVYRIWANFIPQVPWTAVPDLLLSRLCREVGYELYEMDITIRNILLKELKEDERFGQQRLNDLAAFLLDYVAQHLHSNDPQVRDLAQAQQWTALAHTQPGEAARKLALILSKLVRNDRVDLLRVTSLVETLAEPLAEFRPLLVYARGMVNFTRGDLEKAAEQFSKVLEGRNQIQIANVILPIPNRIKTLFSIIDISDGELPSIKQQAVVNPFMSGGAVSDLMKQLKFNPIVDRCRHLLTGHTVHNIAIEGERGFGKTTLLRVLKQTAHQEKWGEPEFKLVLIYLDCSTIDPFTPTYFWRRIFEKLRDEFQDNFIFRERIHEALAQSEALDLSDVENLYTLLKEYHYVLVLLLDEFDTIARTDTVDPGIIRGFLAKLRSSYDPDCVALVTCTRESLAQVSSIIEWIGSPFSNIFQSVSLTLFDFDEIIGILNEAFEGIAYEMDQTDRSLLWNLGGGNPVLTLEAGELIFEQRHQGPLTNQDAKTIIRNFEIKASRYFSLYWNKSSLLEQTLFIGLILSYLTKQSFPLLSKKDVEFIDQLLQIYEFNLRPLSERGLITAEGETYRLFSLAFATWIVRKVAGEGESRLAKRYQALESDWLKQTWQTFKELTRPPMLRDVLQTLDVGESMLTDKH